MQTLRAAAAATFLVLACDNAYSTPIALDTTALNGLTQIYSATFDGALTPCVSGSSTYCTFFGGDPATTNNVTTSPTPTGLVNHLPGGIGPTGTPVAPVPLSGSFLDLTLSGGNTQVTLGTSSITFGALDLCVYPASGCSGINTHVVDAGMVLNAPGAAIGGALTPAGGGSTGATVALDANRKAVFQVQNAGQVMADFSRFSQVMTSCTGSYCPLFTLDIINLDMVRYVLEVQYDPTFTAFTARLSGQTANNSLLYANLTSVPIPGAVWLLGSALGVLSWARRRVLQGDLC